VVAFTNAAIADASARKFFTVFLSRFMLTKDCIVRATSSTVTVQQDALTATARE
jgi:hypothetical protein